MPSATAAATRRGFTVRPVNSFFGETFSASFTASFVISDMRRDDAPMSPASASSTTVERRSSSSGWLRSMSEAISAAVNLRISGFTSAKYATEQVKARPAAQSAQRTQDA